MTDYSAFTEKFLLAREASSEAKPEGGLSGLEIEWNLLDSQFHPLLTIGSGPYQRSFVDFLRADYISPRFKEYSQMEVFHWMIEWATRPYYHPQSAIYESRLMEAILINALFRAGQKFDERFYMWHGNLPFKTHVDHDAIPGSWHLAKRRYLERCISLYGDSLATAGTHTNLSLPDALFEWDYLKLPKSDRTGGISPPLYLDEYKSEFYISATRSMRAFACLFIATSAATPFLAGIQNNKPVVFLSRYDSLRNLTFPNSRELDKPDLYQSLDKYLNISYDLVRRGVRFGNNNWTPTRARSFAEPVERIIDLTSEQLHDFYGKGLFVLGKDQPLEDMVNEIEMQNLLARINLPMERLEVRTDDQGNDLETEIANISLKYLLLLRFYADPEFTQSFQYNSQDIERVRKNEELASKFGLNAEIENPFKKAAESTRDYLSWTLSQVEPLAEELGYADDLQPLRDMASGGPNQAEKLRAFVCKEIGDQTLENCEQIPVPLDILKGLAEEREEQVKQDVELIAENFPLQGEDSQKLAELLQYCREDVHLDPLSPIRFRPRPEAMIEVSYPDKASEIISLAKQLIEIPSVTVGGEVRFEEVIRAGIFIFDYLRNHGLDVNYYNQSDYPAILASFDSQVKAPVMLSGHFDVVAPEPDETQFIPFQDGDYLWGRGSADMKTVLATYLVWMKDQAIRGAPYPGINLLMVGNEESGEQDPMGSPHVLRLLKHEGYEPELFIAGERTGERGDESWGQICIENRGVMRFEVIARGEKGHSGVASQTKDISTRLLNARTDIAELLESSLTLSSNDAWRSQVAFPFIQIGKPGIYNIRPDLGRVGVEIRPIPEDDIDQLIQELDDYCRVNELELIITVKENGIACDPQNPYLIHLIEAVKNTSKMDPVIGKKLPGTSARFAPRGQGIVWGQSGLNPHAKEERHYIPSIVPYYDALNAFAEALRDK